MSSGKKNQSLYLCILVLEYMNSLILLPRKNVGGDNVAALEEKRKLEIASCWRKSCSEVIRYIYFCYLLKLKGLGVCK